MPVNLKVCLKCELIKVAQFLGSRFYQSHKKGEKTPCKEAKWFCSDVLPRSADDKQGFLITNKYQNLG